jgi:hypothetical protein
MHYYAGSWLDIQFDAAKQKWVAARPTSRACLQSACRPLAKVDAALLQTGDLIDAVELVRAIEFWPMVAQWESPLCPLTQGLVFSIPKLVFSVSVFQNEKTNAGFFNPNWFLN